MSWLMECLATLGLISRTKGRRNKRVRVRTKMQQNLIKTRWSWALALRNEVRGRLNRDPLNLMEGYSENYRSCKNKLQIRLYITSNEYLLSGHTGTFHSDLALRKSIRPVTCLIAGSMPFSNPAQKRFQDLVCIFRQLHRKQKSISANKNNPPPRKYLRSTDRHQTLAIPLENSPSTLRINPLESINTIRFECGSSNGFPLGYTMHMQFFYIRRTALIIVEVEPATRRHHESRKR